MTSEPLTATPDGERRCLCVLRHSPVPMELHRHHVWPLGEGGPDTSANLRWLCPSQHSSVHRLWREYDKRGGKPSWGILRHYNKHARDLVADGWAQAHPEPVLF